ncbi:MAG: MFS transporter, partial [Christensenellales bacterium]
MGKSKANSLGAKTWSSIVIFGLVGQIAWVLENMYFNIFMDRTVTRDPVAIWVMVAASAVVATLFTLLAG